MSKTNATLLMLAVILVGFYYGGIEIPMQLGIYSPPAAFLSPYDAEVRVYGRVMYANETPAAGITVRLFATDELIEDFTTTCVDGYFISNIYFSTGQIITVSVDGIYLRHEPKFVPYDAEAGSEHDLGVFVYEP